MTVLCICWKRQKSSLERENFYEEGYDRGGSRTIKASVGKSTRSGAGQGLLALPLLLGQGEHVLVRGADVIMREEPARAAPHAAQVTAVALRSGHAVLALEAGDLRVGASEEVGLFGNTRGVQARNDWSAVIDRYGTLFARLVQGVRRVPFDSKPQSPAQQPPS